TELRRRRRRRIDAARLDDRARSPFVDGIFVGGRRSMDRLRRRHGALRARYRPVDRAPAMVAARRSHAVLVNRMALNRVLIALIIAWPLAERAQSDAGAPEPPPDAGVTPELEPPTPLGETSVPYPADAPPETEPIVVKVKILVGADGAVQKVELLTHSLPAF